MLGPLVITLLTLLANAPSAASGSRQEALTAFIDVSVIPMDSERVLAGQTVLVRGREIAEIGPVGQVQVPTGAVRVDGTGKFLIPGLGDMHAHIAPPGHTDQALPESVSEQMLFLFLANGVTTIRNMNGNPQHLELRERAANGELLSPLLYTAGPGFLAEGMTVATVADAVAEQKTMGYDLLKVIDPDRASFDTLAAAAHRVNIPFAGHVPRAVGIERALAAPYASIEHLEGYANYFFSATGTDGRSVPAGAGGSTFDTLATPDESKISTIAAATKRAGVWNCPTLAVFNNWVADTATLMRQPGIQYMSSETLDMWLMLKGILSGADPTVRATNRVKPKLIKALHDAGAGLLLGADAIAPYTIPGFSIHQELQAFVAAGLTPYEALETGTRNVAVFLGTADRTGTVAVGKRADLVLLKGNPLENVGHTAQPAGVMIGGRWLSRQEIDTRLAAIEGQI